MAWGTPPSWSAGNVITAAKLTTISDDLTFLRTPPSCRVFNNAAISIPNSSNTALTFNSERWDSDTMHSTSVSTGRITFTQAGKYQIGGAVEFAANATGQRTLALRLNGTTFFAIHVQDACGAGATDMVISSLYTFAAADYAELVVAQNSGGAINVSVQGNWSPEFYATWVSA